MNKNSAHSSKLIRLHEIFHKEKYLSIEKVILMVKFANQHKTFSKRNGLQGWLYCRFLNLPENTYEQKNITTTDEWDCYLI